MMILKLFLVNNVGRNLGYVLAVVSTRFSLIPNSAAMSLMGRSFTDLAISISVSI